MRAPRPCPRPPGPRFSGARALFAPQKAGRPKGAAWARSVGSPPVGWGLPAGAQKCKFLYQFTNNSYFLVRLLHAKTYVCISYHNPLFGKLLSQNRPIFGPVTAPDPSFCRQSARTPLLPGPNPLFSVRNPSPANICFFGFAPFRHHKASLLGFIPPGPLRLAPRRHVRVPGPARARPGPGFPGPGRFLPRKKQAAPKGGLGAVRRLSADPHFFAKPHHWGPPRDSSFCSTGKMPRSSTPVSRPEPTP